MEGNNFLRMLCHHGWCTTIQIQKESVTGGEAALNDLTMFRGTASYFIVFPNMYNHAAKNESRISSYERIMERF
ncbi:hypothetical protein KH172YL63_16800 [Bacillus sp. KH172YL63]|nr:hypothetical protein KH172YL63_16800 [Bacillus sp. KH172YL63]